MCVCARARAYAHTKKNLKREEQRRRKERLLCIDTHLPSNKCHVRDGVTPSPLPQRLPKENTSYLLVLPPLHQVAALLEAVDVPSIGEK